MALDPTLTHNLRTTIEHVVENEFWSIAANLKYQRFTKRMATDTLSQIFTHRVAGAILEDYGETGGGIRYEDAVIASQEFRNHYVKSGFRLPEGEFKDFARKGIQLASEWGQDVGYAGAYWPQKRGIQVLRNGTSTYMITENGNLIKLLCYDGLSLFNNAHPYNFKRPSLGVFTNIASNANTVATQPKFLPLGGPFVKNSGTGVWEYNSALGNVDAVSNDDALNNLFLMIAHVQSIRMPDGITPRNLEPTLITHGPKLLNKVLTLTSAEFINSSVGSREIKATITKLGLSDPCNLLELQNTGTVNEDWDWYAFCEPQIARSRFGAICYGELEPFQLYMFAATSGSEGVNLKLAEDNEVRWITQGRNLVGPGMPHLVFKSQAPRS